MSPDPEQQHPITQWCLANYPSLDLGTACTHSGALLICVHEMAHMLSLGEKVVGRPLCGKIDALRKEAPEQMWENELLCRASDYILFNHPQVSGLDGTPLKPVSLEWLVARSIRAAERFNAFWMHQPGEAPGGKGHYLPYEQSLEIAKGLLAGPEPHRLAERILELAI